MNKLSLLAILLTLIACGKSPEKPADGFGGELKDISAQAGISFHHDAGENGSYFIPEQVGSGVALFDADNDGDIDIYLVNARSHDGSQPPGQWSRNQFFRQEGEGRFVNATAESGLGDQGFGMGAAAGDYDNDGDLDLYLTNYDEDQLFQNQGDGTFRNVTTEAGIRNPRWGCSATFIDYDRDGFLDIFVANYLQIDSTITCTDRSGRPEYCGPDFQPAAPDVLFRNNGDGTFSDVSFASRIGLTERRGLGVVAADFNFDGYPDLYVANDGDENTLWINRKDGSFVDQGLPMGVAVNRLGAREAGMGIAIGDVSGRLTQDILVTHLEGESNTLYLNQGLMGFEDASQKADLERMELLSYTGFGVGLADLNLDANLDLVIGNGRVKRLPGVYETGEKFWSGYAEPNLVFEGLGGGRFRNVSAAFPEYSAPVETSRGLAFADIDNDGDIDFLVSNCGGPARLYRNDLQRKGNWVMLTLYDPALKRVVNNSRVLLSAGGKKMSAEVIPGYSYLSSNDHRVHFGLGEIQSIDKITVTWLGGAVEDFTELAVNRHLTLEKGKGKAVETP
ncbi:MAG: CRTAC1 family protein [Calditrichaeota bacterium]|nr:CRTAC1 family protein [Calditrichota bacterium]HQU73009.1 CRTAC1 family protein [Calditrichia bacterium]